MGFYIWIDEVVGEGENLYISEPCCMIIDFSVCRRKTGFFMKIQYLLPIFLSSVHSLRQKCRTTFALVLFFHCAVLCAAYTGIQCRKYLFYSNLQKYAPGLQGCNSTVTPIAIKLRKWILCLSYTADHMNLEYISGIEWSATVILARWSYRNRARLTLQSFIPRTAVV